jgi:hypothetical protein
VFFFIVSKVGFQPYLRLDTLGLARDTFIKHKEVVMIYEESGLVIANCNALIIHPKSKPIAQLVFAYITIKQWLTYSNCGKTSHAKGNLSQQEKRRTCSTYCFH